MHQPGQLNATPQQVCLGLLVALGIATIARDLLAYAERVRLIEELNADPEGPGRAAEAILREEEGTNGSSDGDHTPPGTSDTGGGSGGA